MNEQEDFEMIASIDLVDQILAGEVINVGGWDGVTAGDLGELTEHLFRFELNEGQKAAARASIENFRLRLVLFGDSQDIPEAHRHLNMTTFRPRGDIRMYDLHPEQRLDLEEVAKLVRREAREAMTPIERRDAAVEAAVLRWNGALPIPTDKPTNRKQRRQAKRNRRNRRARRLRGARD